MIISGDYFRALVNGRRRGPWPASLRCGLWAASFPYGWITRCRNRLYDRGYKECRRVAVPVVSVGNLTLGGTGKTPCVEYVSRYYGARQRRVAILSRGYGGVRGRNDEALLLAENVPEVPHLQGRDRVALAEEAVARLGSEVLVLDDGFQHRRLARDLDIVLIDASEPWGHGYLFPRGLLREAPAGLSRAGVVLMTRCDQSPPAERERLRQTIARLAPNAPLAEARHRPLELIDSAQGTAPLAHLADRPVAAFCGIGNPDAFRRTLADLGSAVTDFRTYPDHHVYTRTDVEDLDSWAGQLATECVVVTTQKDLVKLRVSRLGGRELWALRIGLDFEAGQDAFDRTLSLVLGP